MVMKIKGDKYATMLAAMRAVVDYLGGPATIKQGGLGQMALLWTLWNIASDNLRYDDTHPWFKNGKWKRVIPQNASFDMYSDDDNDRTIETALKAIGRELGL